MYVGTYRTVCSFQSCGIAAAPKNVGICKERVSTNVGEDFVCQRAQHSTKGALGIRVSSQED